MLSTATNAEVIRFTLLFVQQLLLLRSPRVGKQVFPDGSMGGSFRTGMFHTFKSPSGPYLS